MIKIDILKEQGVYEDKYFVYELKPARKGGVFGSPRKDGKEKIIKYPIRIKVTAKEELKKEINETKD